MWGNIGLRLFLMWVLVVVMCWLSVGWFRWFCSLVDRCIFSGVVMVFCIMLLLLVVLW